MNSNLKKSLYEAIMKSVSLTVKNALNESMSQEEKMDLWHEGKRRLNVTTLSDDKLRTNLEICVNKGYTNEINILTNEANNRSLDVSDIVSLSLSNKPSNSTQVQPTTLSREKRFKLGVEDDGLHTGLPYDPYQKILDHGVIGQISDGIGEGFDRSSRMFVHYYGILSGMQYGNVKGELVIKDPIDLDLLIKCIWRVASIERNDNDSTERNVYYYYMDANWKEICTLQAALKKLSEIA